MKALRVVLPVGVLALSGCAPGAGTASTSDTYAGLWAGLCYARTRASDPEGARQAFLDGAHQPLHELAAAAAESDRVAAGRLLEARQAVERDLVADAARLGSDLDALLAATRAALMAARQPPPRPCQRHHDP